MGEIDLQDNASIDDHQTRARDPNSRSVRLARLKVHTLADRTQNLVQRDSLIEAEPLTSVSMVGQAEPIDDEA